MSPWQDKNILDNYNFSETLKPHQRLYKRYFTKAKQRKWAELKPKYTDWTKKTWTENLIDGFLAPSGVYFMQFLGQGNLVSTSLSSYTLEMRSGVKKTVKRRYPEDLHSKLYIIYCASKRRILFWISFYILWLKNFSALRKGFYGKLIISP